MSTPGEGQREAPSDFDCWHELKTDPAVFDRVELDYKRHEIRFNDRNYAVGDGLLLRRTRYTGAEMKAGAPLEYTGHECRRIVTDVLRGPVYGLVEGWVIMSIRPLHNAGASVPEPASRALSIREVCELAEMGGIYDEFTDAASALTQMGQHIRELQAEIDRLRAGADVEGPSEPLMVELRKVLREFGEARDHFEAGGFGHLQKAHCEGAATAFATAFNALEAALRLAAPATQEAPSGPAGFWVTEQDYWDEVNRRLAALTPPPPEQPIVTYTTASPSAPTEPLTTPYTIMLDDGLWGVDVVIAGHRFIGPHFASEDEAEIESRAIRAALSVSTAGTALHPDAPNLIAMWAAADEERGADPGRRMPRSPDWIEARVRSLSVSTSGPNVDTTFRACCSALDYGPNGPRLHYEGCPEETARILASAPKETSEPIAWGVREGAAWQTTEDTKPHAELYAEQIRELQKTERGTASEVTVVAFFAAPSTPEPRP